MTAKDVAAIASRALAIIMLAYALATLSQLPHLLDSVKSSYRVAADYRTNWWPDLISYAVIGLAYVYVAGLLWFRADRFWPSSAVVDGASITIPQLTRLAMFVVGAYWLIDGAPSMIQVFGMLALPEGASRDFFKANYNWEAFSRAIQGLFAAMLIGVNWPRAGEGGEVQTDETP